MRTVTLTVVAISIFLVVASITTNLNIVPLVHASSSSLICMADPGFAVNPSANACPSTVPSLNGPNATSSGAQLRVNINVNNTSSLNGFDISILADHTRLRPFGIDLTSGMLTGVSISNECVGGIAVQGVCPAQAAGNPDSIQLGVGGGAFSPNPSFGTLFTAIYTIVGNTTGTSLSFQSGCGNQTSLPPLCIVITSGGSANVPVSSVSTATYRTSSTAPFSPFFTLKPRPLVLNFTQGTAGTGNSNVTLTELNGFSCGGVNCVTVSTIKPSAAGLSVSTNVTSLTDPPGNGVKISVATNAFTPAGIFTIYLQAAPATPAASQPAPPGTTYIGAITNVTVTIVSSSNFAMAANPVAVIDSIGTTATSTIQVAGGKIFTGLVGLSTTISPSTGLTCSVNPNSLTSSTAPWLKTALLSCNSTVGGTYSVTVTGTYSTITHTIQVTFITPTFTLTPTPTSLTVLAGQTGTVTINLKSINGFSGTVALSTSILPSCTCLALSPANVILLSGRTNSSTLTMTLPQNAAGSYVITITGSSGPVTQMAQVTISTGSANVTIVSVTSSPTTPVVGDMVTFTVKLNNTGTLLGNFSVWINWGTTKVTPPINDTLAPGPTKTESLSWDTRGYMAGSFPITVVVWTPGGNNGPGSQLTGQTLALGPAPPPLFNTTTLAIIGGAAVVVVIGVAAVFLRRRSRTRIL